MAKLTSDGANNFAKPCCSSLADVLAAIAASQLAKPRRQDMASAVRTIAKVLGHAPGNIPADPGRLGIRLKSVSPAAHQISTTRWNNIRSLLRAALALVTPVMAGRDDTPLSETWAALFAVVGEKRSERIRLSRLVHWFSRHQISPQAVTLSDLERFHQQLLTDALLKDPGGTWRDTHWAWNRAVKSVPGWPQLAMERKSRKEVYVMKWERFPASLKKDVDGWLNRLACSDFNDDGPMKPVRPGTLTIREYQLRAFASALVLRGREARNITSLTACLTSENFNEGLKYFCERAGGKTTSIFSMASMLKGVATHWVKADDATLKKMSQTIRKLAVDQKGLTRKNRDRLRPIEDPEKQKALVGLPVRLHDLVVRGKISRRRCSVLAQVAVAVEILLFCAIRVGNLAAIDIDRHLLRVGKKLHLVIPAEEVKNDVDLEFELADETTSLIEWYIKEQRSAPAGCKALFPGRNGGCKSISALRGQIIKMVRDYTGLEVHPHLFRHIGAQIYLSQHPGGYEVMRRVLGHKSMATTTNSYTGLQTRSATQHFGQTVMSIRQLSDREQAS